jgi:putative hydrolase of the HAD superfamily
MRGVMRRSDASHVVLWDFDGTLAFREGMWSQAVADVVARRCPTVAVSRESVSPYLSSGFFWHSPERPHPHIEGSDQWWSELFPVLERAICLSSGLTTEQARRLLPEVRSEFLRPTAWTVYPDVEPCLKRLEAQGWSHVIISNHVPELEELVLSLGLGRYFAAVFSSAHLGYEKPHPEAFRSVLRALSPHAEFRMVGDSYVADVVGAEQVGIPCVLVRKPHASATRYEADLTKVEFSTEASRADA